MVTDLRPRAREGSKEIGSPSPEWGLAAALAGALVPIRGAVLASGPTASAAPGNDVDDDQGMLQDEHQPVRHEPPPDQEDVSDGGHDAHVELGSRGTGSAARDSQGQGPAVAVGVSDSSSTSVVLTKVLTLVPVLSTAAVPDAGTYYVNASVALVVASGDSLACILEGPSGAVGKFAVVGPVSALSYQTRIVARGPTS